MQYFLSHINNNNSLHEAARTFNHYDGLRFCKKANNRSVRKAAWYTMYFKKEGTNMPEYRIRIATITIAYVDGGNKQIFG